MTEMPSLYDKYLLKKRKMNSHNKLSMLGMEFRILFNKRDPEIINFHDPNEAEKYIHFIGEVINQNIR